MKYAFTLGVSGLSLLIAGCSLPTSSPRCGGSLNLRSYDTDGDGIDDAPGIEYKWDFVACAIPGDDVGVAIYTVPDGSSRRYELLVMEGPDTGSSYKVYDLYDAISAFDQILIASGYDLSNTTTDAFRTDCKNWLINNMMTASSFHATYGY